MKFVNISKWIISSGICRPNRAVAG